MCFLWHCSYWTPVAQCKLILKQCYNEDTACLDCVGLSLILRDLVAASTWYLIWWYIYEVFSIPGFCWCIWKAIAPWVEASAGKGDSACYNGYLHTGENSLIPYYAYLTQKFCEYHRRFQVRINFYVAKENKNAIFLWYFPSLNGNSAVEMNRTQDIHRIRFVEMDSKNSQQNFRSNFMIWPDVIKIVMYCLKSELPRKLNSLKLCACSPGHI